MSAVLVRLERTFLPPRFPPRCDVCPSQSGGALGWVAEAYALKNPDEFFTVSYTDWLRARYGLPLRREPDEAGIF